MEIKIQTISTVVGLIATIGGVTYFLMSYVVEREFDTVKCYLELGIEEARMRSQNLEEKWELDILEGEIELVKRQISILGDPVNSSNEVNTNLSDYERQLARYENERAGLETTMESREVELGKIQNKIEKCGYRSPKDL